MWSPYDCSGEVLLGPQRGHRSPHGQPPAWQPLLGFLGSGCRQRSLLWEIRLAPASRLTERAPRDELSLLVASMAVPCEELAASLKGFTHY